VPLRRAIEARGIPVEVVGLGGLLVVPEVQDVVATLRVLHDAGASDALARLLTGPRWRIGPRDLVALGRRARVLVRGEAPQPQNRPQPDQADPLAEAITDLTAETGSLVEALDDLGDPAAYSDFTRLQIGSFIETAEDLAERTGAQNGCIYHIDNLPTRLGPLRPAAGAGGYRTSIPGLYLGSPAASCGGVSGLPAKHCAAQVLTTSASAALASDGAAKPAPQQCADS